MELKAANELNEKLLNQLREQAAKEEERQRVQDANAAIDRKKKFRENLFISLLSAAAGSGITVFVDHFSAVERLIQKIFSFFNLSS